MQPWLKVCPASCIQRLAPIASCPVSGAHCFLPSVLRPVSRAMPPKTLGVLETEILRHIEKQHCGSGDLELEDAVDPCQYLTERFASAPADFACIIKELQTHLERLDGTWAGRRSKPESCIPLQPAPGSSVDMWVSVTHLGFTVESSVKGKSSPSASWTASKTSWRSRLQV